MKDQQLDMFSTTTAPAQPARVRKVEPIHSAPVRVRDNEYFPPPAAGQVGQKVSRHKKPNPCVKAFGPGPEGKTCKSCCKLIPKGYHDKKYFKCFLRGNTNGAGTDHRATWPACGKYVELPPP